VWSTSVSVCWDVATPYCCARTFYQPRYLMIPSIRVDVAISDSHTTLAGGDSGIAAYYELAGTGKDELQTLSLVAAPTVVLLRIAGACIQPVTVPVSVSTTCSSSLALGQGSELCCDFGMSSTPQKDCCRDNEADFCSTKHQKMT
jgi:hypothetical protein